MANFFQFFPKIEYDIAKTGITQTATNIMKRFDIVEIVKKNGFVYSEYIVKDGERPDIIADKFYGKSNLSWVIMLLNNIKDLYTDWPMEYRVFQNYIIKKYGSTSTAYQTVHHYEKIVQKKQTITGGLVSEEKTIWVDHLEYIGLPETDRKSISVYDYENDLNESKRNIKILKPEYISQIENEMKDVLK